ncbi:MAG: hypothetical protein GY754_17290 [bacterium]|nr:hypothetical protein [bacterium]
MNKVKKILLALSILLLASIFVYNNGLYADPTKNNNSKSSKSSSSNSNSSKKKSAVGGGMAQAVAEMEEDVLLESQVSKKINFIRKNLTKFNSGKFTKSPYKIFWLQFGTYANYADFKEKREYEFNNSNVGLLEEFLNKAKEFGLEFDSQKSNTSSFNNHMHQKYVGLGISFRPKGKQINLDDDDYKILMSDIRGIYNIVTKKGAFDDEKKLEKLSVEIVQNLGKFAVNAQGLDIGTIMLENFFEIPQKNSNSNNKKKKKKNIKISLADIIDILKYDDESKDESQVAPQVEISKLECVKILKKALGTNAYSHKARSAVSSKSVGPLFLAIETFIAEKISHDYGTAKSGTRNYNDSFISEMDLAYRSSLESQRKEMMHKAARQASKKGHTQEVDDRVDLSDIADPKFKWIRQQLEGKKSFSHSPNKNHSHDIKEGKEKMLSFGSYNKYETAVDNGSFGLNTLEAFHDYIKELSFQYDNDHIAEIDKIAQRIAIRHTNFITTSWRQLDGVNTVELSSKRSNITKINAGITRFKLGKISLLDFCKMIKKNIGTELFDAMSTKNPSRPTIVRTASSIQVTKKFSTKNLTLANIMSIANGKDKASQDAVKKKLIKLMTGMVQRFPYGDISRSQIDKNVSKFQLDFFGILRTNLSLQVIEDKKALQYFEFRSVQKRVDHYLDEIHKNSKLADMQ